MDLLIFNSNYKQYNFFSSINLKNTTYLPINFKKLFSFKFIFYFIIKFLIHIFNFNLIKCVIHDLKIIFDEPYSRRKKNKQTDENSSLNFYIFKKLIICLIWKLYFDMNFSKFKNLYVICYYDSSCLGALLSFKLNSKKIYDIQHGYMGEHHYAYKSESVNNLKILSPSGFIVWKNNIFNKNYVYDKIEYPLNLPKIKTKKNHIVGLIITHDFEYNELIEVISIIKKNKNIIFDYRVHPSYTMNEFKSFQIFKLLSQLENLKITYSSDLYNWLKDKKYIILGVSTIIEEVIEYSDSIIFCISEISKTRYKKFKQFDNVDFVKISDLKNLESFSL